MHAPDRAARITPRLRVVVWRIVAGNIVCFCCGVGVAVAVWAPLTPDTVIAAGVGFLLGLGFALWLTVEFRRGAWV